LTTKVNAKLLWFKCRGSFNFAALGKDEKCYAAAGNSCESKMKIIKRS
jgi:hypothetical protein